MGTKGKYVPVLAGGRTVNAALNKEEMKQVAEQNERNGEARVMEAVMKVNKKKASTPMPPVMGVCMLPMHDELSLRSSGELPSDFDSKFPDGGALPFDRHPEFSETWLRYDKVDVYGQPLRSSKL